MLSILFLALYVILLISSYLCLSCVKGYGYDPSAQVVIIIAVILAVLLIQSILFCEIYRSIYESDCDSFSGSDFYKTRKQAEAVKSLWLSKDVQKDYYFPNWLLLELSDYLKDKKGLDVFYKAYKKFYGSELTYNSLRRMLSEDYSELLVRMRPKPPPPNMPLEGSILDLPGVQNFILRLSSALSSHGLTLDVHDKKSPQLNNIALLLLTLTNELSSDIPINRLDVLLSVKSNEIRGLLGNGIVDEKKEDIRQDIEKTLFYYLARSILVKTSSLPIQLSQGDFLFYSALSFFTASTGDIQPVSHWARICTFLQVAGTFIIIALTISFLSVAVEGVGGVPLSDLKKMILPICSLLGLAVLLTVIIICCRKCYLKSSYAEILSVPENYGYTMRRNGIADLMINVNNPSASSYLSKFYTLSMPYTATFGENVRWPGVLVAKDSIKIVWAELFPPTNDRLYVYGDGYDIGTIKENYKLLIPASITAFSGR